MCNCGCNTCKTKIRGPLLTEGLISKSLISENLQYHIDKNIPLMENVFRIGSDAHLSMIKEAKKLYSRGVLDLCEEDEGLMETHLGEFDLFENEIVPLDLPMIDLKESKYEKVKVGDILTKDGKKGKVVKVMDDMANVDFGNGDVYGITFSRIKGKEIVNENEQLDEKKKAKKKTKKDPPIGKPKRGGPKAYYVYVRDPKTKKIKKVTFGSGGLRAKIRNPKARKAFAARHKCSQKTDRTKPSYWSCRLPRYASQLGLGANMNTFW